MNTRGDLHTLLPGAIEQILEQMAGPLRTRMLDNISQRLEPFPRLQLFCFTIRIRQAICHRCIP
jgi:hypothetical protein